MSGPDYGLDLFCCSGGCSVGYNRAGFEMVGSDLHPQPHYPFPFLQADALDVLDVLLGGGAIPFGGRWFRLTDFAFIHASPPCQDYTTLKAVHGNEWPRLIVPVRERLQRAGLPYIIENVGGAKAELIDPIMLCGEMFGLEVIRHRYFESNVPLKAPAHVEHRGRVKGWRHGEFFEGPYFAVYGEGGGKGTVEEWQRAMGIDWTSDRREIAEAVPPDYAQHLGGELIKHLEASVQL